MTKELIELLTKQSEHRERVNLLSGKAEPTETETAELTELRTKLTANRARDSYPAGQGRGATGRTAGRQDGDGRGPRTQGAPVKDGAGPLHRVGGERHPAAF